jgi:hypothetical protein
MKKFVILFILALATINASAVDRSHYHNDRGNNPSFNSGSSNTPSVGAPLDGFLLLGLGAAGVAYYAGKKKNQEK